MLHSQALVKKADRFTTECLEGLRRAQALRAEVIAPAPRSIDDTLVRYNELLTAASASNALAGLMSEVHPDEKIRDAARTMRPGAWLIVAGGWNVQQFKENRRPTQAELVAAAPNNPVYVQLGYGWSMLTPQAMKALSISSEADLPSALGRVHEAPRSVDLVNRMPGVKPSIQAT